MRLACLLYKYFPYGGMQRDFRRLVEELQARGHHCRVYCLQWQGEALPGAELRRVPVSAITSHRRNERYLQWVRDDLAADPVDGVIGFNKMPGLDVYFAADSCYLEKVLNDRGWLYRRSARCRHFARYERAVFAADSATEVLLISEHQRASFTQYYHTPAQRLHLLPPGIAPDRRAPPDARARRAAKRDSLGLEREELVLLFVGSGFITKGLDRAITALARVRAAQPAANARLLVVGQDNSRRFERLARRLGVDTAVSFMGGRDDVPDLLLAADLLVHPARREAAGIVLLEALVAGLPVVVTDVCGYAPHVQASRGGIILPAPYRQEQLEAAIMRNIDGVFRADCRASALAYAERTDLYSMHRTGAALIESLVLRKQASSGD